MMRASRMNPYRLYLFGIESPLAVLVALAQTTCIVYYVTIGRLNPLQLVTLGTSVELSYFFMQLPTGVLADLVSRRLCVVAGTVLIGIGFFEQGLSPAFGNLLAGQFVIGLGAALQEGALDAWIAGELDERRMTRVYLRATQLGLAGGVVGAVLSALLASVRLSLPLLVGGGGVMLVGLGLGMVMPERRREERGPTADDAVPEQRVLRSAWTGFTGQLRESRAAIVLVPGFVLLLGTVFFLGLWSESFDRLWGDFLLKDFRLPDVFGLHPAGWFSAIAIAVSLLGVGTTHLAGRWLERLERHDGDEGGESGESDEGGQRPEGASTGPALLLLTALIGLGVALMASGHTFALAIVAYLLVKALRPVVSPLVTGWIVARVDPGVRATVLSARDMLDSAGQIVGGPFVGLIGLLGTVRTALYAGALALLPALGLLSAASARMATRSSEAADSPRYRRWW